VIGTRRLHPREDLITGMLTFDGTQLVSCSSTGLAAREALLALGGFDPALGTSADWDLLLRTLLDGGVTYVDEPLVLYRRHGSNMSRNVAATERDMRRAYAKAFANPLLPKSARRLRRHAYARLYRMLAGSYLECGARSDALRALALALAREPTIAIGLLRRRGHRSRG
jgi:hypothetical protein